MSSFSNRNGPLCVHKREGFQRRKNSAAACHSLDSIKLLCLCTRRRKTSLLFTKDKFRHQGCMLATMAFPTCIWTLSAHWMYMRALVLCARQGIPKLPYIAGQIQPKSKLFHGSMIFFFKSKEGAEPKIRKRRREGCLFKAEKHSLPGKKSPGSREPAKESQPNGRSKKMKNFALDGRFFFYMRSATSLIQANCKALALF